MRSITLDSDSQEGNFYVAEVDSGRAQKFRPRPGANHQLRVGRTGVWSNSDLTTGLGGQPATFDSLTAYARNYEVPVKCSPTQICSGNALEEFVFVFYVDTGNAVHVMVIGPIPTPIYAEAFIPSYDRVLTGAPLPAVPWGLGCRGTSLATITSDAGGGADVYFIGVFGDIYKFGTMPPLVPGGFGGFGYKGDQTLTYGGVPAGEPQGCLFG